MKIVNNPNMKTIKDKKLVVGADFAGYPLKEAVCKHLRERGWEIEDLGVNTRTTIPRKTCSIVWVFGWAPRSPRANMSAH